MSALERECDRAGLDPKRVASIARRDAVAILAMREPRGALLECIRGRSTEWDWQEMIDAAISGVTGWE